MPGLTSVPQNVTDAGHQFNYNVWTAGTQVRLCNVTWANDYRDIVDFDSQDHLDNYLNTTGGGSFTGIDKLTYVRPGMPIRLSMPFARALSYNYMRVSNPAQPVHSVVNGTDRVFDMPKVYYYFILDVRHIAPNTTEFIVQLDVWQTFGRNVKFGRCYVERGHLGIANRNRDHDNGRHFLSIPEGLDTGDAQVVVKADSHAIEHPSMADNDPKAGWGRSAFVVVSTVDFKRSGGTTEDPKLVTASNGSYGNGLAGGANIYYCPTIVQLTGMFDTFAEKPWISQGIIAIYVVPQVISKSDLESDSFEKVQLVPGASLLFLYKFKGGSARKSAVFDLKVPNFNWYTILQNSLPARYRHLTKFLTFPYSSVQVSLFNGQTLLMHPEYIYSKELDFNIMFHVGMPSPRIAVVPKSYNGIGAYGEELDFAAYLSNLPQVPAVNNSYLNYLASNTNQISYQYESAEWSQQRAMQGNQLAFNQASANMGLSNERTGLGVGARNQTTGLANETLGYRGVQSGANAIVGGVGSGNVLSTAAGMVNAAADFAIGANQNTQQTAINNSLAVATNEANVGNMGYVRDTNKTYADYAAQGDYQNTVAGVNARVQDTKMLQPTVSGQMAGDAFAFVVNNGFKMRVSVKRVDNATLASIGEFWLRYGYAVNRFHNVDELSIMQNFTYWKMHETSIYPYSSCPESYRTTIRGIFEKGVTVWRNPQHIMSLDIGDNPVRADKPVTLSI